MIKKLLTMLLIVSLLFISAGCKPKDSNSRSGANYTYTVKVISAGKTAKEYKIDEIKKFEVKSIKVDGKTEDGPQLIAVLKDAGIKSYSQVTLKSITGTTQKLTKDQIDEETLLDITNHDTVKLASKIIPKNDWLKDITEIIVEEK